MILKKTDINLKILIIEDDFVARNYLRDLLRYSNIEVLSARNVPEGLDLYIQNKFDIIVCNVLMPGVSGMEFLQKIREKDRKTHIIMTATKSSERIVVECFRQGANDFLKYPIQDSDILPRIRKVEEKIALKGQKTPFGIVNFGKVEMVFPTEFDVTYRIAERIFEEIIPDFFDESADTEIRIGLMELICNAVEHGNLSISYAEKKQSIEEGSFNQLIRQRLEDEKLKSRNVYVEFSYTQDYCQWVIKDEGDGFDYNNVPDPTKEENKENFNGRGIHLSKVLFDFIEYQGKGNIVMVRKKRSFLL